MNKLLCFALLILIFSCKSKKNEPGTCDLTVKINNYKNSNLTLLEITPGENIFVAKLNPKKEDEFSYTIKNTEKTIYCLSQDNKFYIYFINDADEIIIETDLSDFENYTIENSPESAQLQDLVNMHKRYSTELFLAHQLLVKNIAHNQKWSFKDPETKVLENRVDKATINLKNFVKEYIDTTSNELIAIGASNYLTTDEDYNYLKQFSETIQLSTGAETIQKRNLTRKISAAANNLRNIPILDSISLINSDKQTISFSPQGKYTFLNLWAPWCYYSRDQNKYLLKTYSHFKNNAEIIFVNIGLDSDIDNWITALQEDSLNFSYNLCDRSELNSELLKHYQVGYVPANFLLDKEGKVITKNMRGEEMIPAINAALNEQ